MPKVAWAPVIMQMLGGPQVAGLIHRVAAVIFAFVFFAHLIWMAQHIATNGAPSSGSARTR